MEETIPIRDFEVILTKHAKEIEDYELIVRNISMVGKKSELEQFVASIYQFGLPYSHNINITHRGEIEIVIFEKNQKQLKKPRKVIFGQIKDFRERQ